MHRVRPSPIDRQVHVMTYEEVLELATTAVIAGTLPNDACVPFSSTVTFRADTGCDLCEQPLGATPAFKLVNPAGPACLLLLHARCFRAWLDVVVTPTV